MTPLIKGSLAQGGYFLAFIGTYRKNGAILFGVKRRTEAASFHAHYIGNWNMKVLTSAGNSIKLYSLSLSNSRSPRLVSSRRLLGPTAA